MPEIRSVGSLGAPAVSGVRVKDHPLAIEAQRLNAIARRVGKRLMLWAARVENHEQELRRILGRDPQSGLDITEAVRDAQGKPIMVPILPDADFRESWALYQRTTMQLLTEQRARAILAPNKGLTPVDDSVLEAELQKIVKQTILTMPADEFKAIASERVSSNDTTVAKPKRKKREPDAP